MADLIDRQKIKARFEPWLKVKGYSEGELNMLKAVLYEITIMPSAQPERLTDDDFETIRIHLNAYKEKLCNQHRWEEADEYQRIIDRFMSFASAQPDVPDTTFGNMISRQAAIDAVRSYYDECDEQEESIEERIERLPSADIDLSGFSDKLWHIAYERGKAEVVRHGHWIRGSGYPHHIFCSICYATYVPNDEWDIWKTDGSDCFRLQRNFCPNCGAKMDEVE